MMKRKGRQSTLIPYKRLLCSLLALIMTVSVIARPTVRAEAESVSVIKLDSKRMAAERLTPLCRHYYRGGQEVA